MKSKACMIVSLDQQRHAEYLAHMERHVAESGQDGRYFMPFAPGGPDRPSGVAMEKLNLDLDRKGWQRCWVAEELASGLVVGHVNLKGSMLLSSRHRCELGLGVEATFRRFGLGLELMLAAINFARTEPRLAWIDLNTFGSNEAAQSLYQKLGFSEIGRIADRFRIDGTSIDDIAMTLSVAV